ncbi:MAG: hypothetical protein IJO39_04420 [Clostridia bacterium]|nr:hypothetical protein [Clostridia bacterium]MBQ7138220.1 hypothetical protein [Clostridia bacterium]
MAENKVGHRPTNERECLHSPSVASAGMSRVMAENKVGHCPTNERECLHSPSVASARHEPGDGRE